MLNIKSDLRSKVNKQVMQLQKEKQKRRWLELLGFKKQSVTITQLLHQPLHIYKIDKIYTLKH